jgi:hypothetical protein
MLLARGRQALMKRRLHDMFGDKVPYKVIGEPVSLPDAKVLAENDPYQFQWWALGLVGARLMVKGLKRKVEFGNARHRSRNSTGFDLLSVCEDYYAEGHKLIID